MPLSRDNVGRLAWLVVLLVVAYVAVESAALALHPKLSVLRSPETSYVRGAGAGWMEAALALRCALGLAFVAALEAGASALGRSRLRLGLSFLSVSACASALLAALPAQGTRTDALTACVFVGLLVGTQFTTMALRLDPVWQPVVRSLGLLAWLAVVPALLLGEAHVHTASLTGLYERVFLGLELVWLLLGAAWLGRRVAGAETNVPVSQPAAS